MSVADAPRSITLEERAAAYGFERHELPNGEAVYYHAERHRYYQAVKANPNGKVVATGPLVGVSTIVKPFDWEPGALMAWAARTDVEGVCALAANGVDVTDPDQARAELARAGLSYRQAKKDAAQRGTNVHKHALHALATGASIPDLVRMGAEEQGYARGVIAFWHEHEPLPEHSEIVVAHIDTRVAGRLDLIYRARGGRRVLLDAKTVSKVPASPVDRLPYTAQHVQVAGYAPLAEYCGYVPVDATEILQVFPDGTYRLVDGQASEADFWAAVGVYRAAGRINGQARAAAEGAAAT